MNRYHEYYLDQTRLILLTKYNYSSFSDIQNFGRLDLRISIKDNKQIISSFSALLLLTNKGPYSFKSIGSGNHYKSDRQKKIIITASLHGSAVFYFIENLLNFYLPRFRYFKGFRNKTLNNFGNFSFTFKDLMVFPQLEDELELFYKLKNLRVVLLPRNKIESNHVFFYSLFGFNFVK